MDLDVYQRAGQHNAFLPAGADIKELRNLTFVKAYLDNFLQDLGNQFAATAKPVIAAVNGYAVGSADIPNRMRFEVMTTFVTIARRWL